VAAQASQGHVGRANRLARDPDAQARRAAVFGNSGSLTNMAACLEAADKLVKAAEEEAAAFAAEAQRAGEGTLARQWAPAARQGHGRRRPAAPGGAERPGA